jgi:hypothetical protein
MVKANGRLLCMGTLQDTRGPADGPHSLSIQNTEVKRTKRRGNRHRSQVPGKERVGAPRQVQDVGSRVFQRCGRAHARGLVAQTWRQSPLWKSLTSARSYRKSELNTACFTSKRTGKRRSPRVRIQPHPDLGIGESLPLTPLFFPNSPLAPSSEEQGVPNASVVSKGPSPEGSGPQSTGNRVKLGKGGRRQRKAASRRTQR